MLLWVMKSRELESPATSHVKPGEEYRSTDPCGNSTKDIGNPDDRIPEPVPGNQEKEDAIAITGNPDIRVPDEVEREDGLRASGAFTKEDAEKEDAEEGDAEDGGRTEKAPEQAQEKEQKDASPGDNPKGQEGPEEHERRHVPGATWLSQRGEPPELQLNGIPFPA
ncbi:hypothetical protein NDU88_008281 [Pleurodeles waltl]|uniref:Uncharacterized protein n=1 Tax=Pleurodeles waltl TaxID=8319 RepID=A0AAV7NW42_PLEWA|nr:hypothetical protein NDU88_008281 [Pleurodeles waltl]